MESEGLRRLREEVEKYPLALDFTERELDFYEKEWERKHGRSPLDEIPEI